VPVAAGLGAGPFAGTPQTEFIGFFRKCFVVVTFDETILRMMKPFPAFWRRIRKQAMRYQFANEDGGQ